MRDAKCRQVSRFLSHRSVISGSTDLANVHTPGVFGSRPANLTRVLVIETYTSCRAPCGSITLACCARLEITNRDVGTGEIGERKLRNIPAGASAGLVRRAIDHPRPPVKIDHHPLLAYVTAASLRIQPSCDLRSSSLSSSYV